MRASILSLLLCLATAGSLFAGDITPEDAANHVGEKVTVRGTVVEVFVSKSNCVYLNFGAKFPNQTFSADVLIKKTPALLANGPQWLKDLEGKRCLLTAFTCWSDGPWPRTQIIWKRRLHGQLRQVAMVTA